MGVQRVRREHFEVFAAMIYPHLEAGDVFLWDDRTLHCNAPGVGDAPATTGLLRACCYVCMPPDTNASPEVTAGRHRAVELGHRLGTDGCRPAYRISYGSVPSDWRVLAGRSTCI
jgi:hypothetical protein